MEAKCTTNPIAKFSKFPLVKREEFERWSGEAESSRVREEQD